MFDQIVNEAASRFGLPVPRVTALLRELLALMANGRSGGAEGFVERFRRAGALDVLSSWFDGKDGSYLAASQVESALGISTLDSLADGSGLPRAAVTSVLTFLLPRVLSRLTPDGVLPSSGILLSHARSIQLPPAAIVDPDADDRHHRRWVPFAAAALLALVGLLWLRGSSGTIEPQLTLINRDGKVTY
jgi:uncharacterized protein YidB (DUF937 family)